MRQIVIFTLKAAGYKVIEAADGQEAFGKARGETVDFVLTDQKMPRIDGITLVQNLHSLAAYATTPILILTTEPSDRMKAKGKAARAAGWLVRPFDWRKLLDVVHKFCA